jgi:hypothetical protein
MDQPPVEMMGWLQLKVVNMLKSMNRVQWKRRGRIYGYDAHELMVVRRTLGVPVETISIKA